MLLQEHALVPFLNLYYKAFLSLGIPPSGFWNQSRENLKVARASHVESHHSWQGFLVNSRGQEAAEDTALGPAPDPSTT